MQPYTPTLSPSIARPYLVPIRRATLVLVLALLLASCGASRRGTTRPITSQEVGSSQGELMEFLNAKAQHGWTTIRATLQGRISLGTRDFSSRINLHARRGMGIRLSAVPFPLIEAARVWFTPEGITLVDMIGKRYAEADYSALSAHLGFELSYEQVEALILGQIFTPGEGTSPKALSRLVYKAQDDGGHQLSGRVSGHDYQFDLDSQAILRGLMVYGLKGKLAFDARYDGVIDVDGFTLPQRSVMRTTKESTNTSATLELEWTRAVSQDDMDESITRPTIKASYDRIDLAVIIKKLTER